MVTHWKEKKIFKI